MSELNEDTIKKLSLLAKIEIPDEQLPTFLASLKQVIDYFDQLKEVDVTTLTPYSHVEEQGIGSLREDVPGKLLDRDLFLKNAPDHIGGMIRVPPVLKQQ